MPAMANPEATAADRRACLALLGATIGRMSTLGFVIKGWGITLLAGLFVVARPQARVEITAVLVIAPLFLWAVDAKLMAVEKAYRRRHAAIAGGGPVDFAMEPGRFADPPVSTPRAMLAESRFLTAFWLALLALAVAGAFVIRSAVERGC